MRLAPHASDQMRNPVAGALTLDEILANNAHRSGFEPAFGVSPATHLQSWREVDTAVSSLADLFFQWRLGEDAVVGVQLGSSPQGALACLALWRAGLVPAMLPLAWRRRECAAALASVGASAILTMSHDGDVACDIAIGLEAIRFIGCFGEDAPDGATPLDDVLARDAGRFVRPDRPDDAADHVAIVTFDAGRTPVARSHNELLAAGLAPLVAARLSGASSLVSTLDLAGLAGLATGLMPWLASGCAATFHQPSTTEAFAAATRAADASHLVAPGRLASRLVADGAFDPETLSALTLVWRAPEGRGATIDVPGDAAIVDVHQFGEIGLCAAARTTPDRPVAPPLGATGPKGFASLIDLKIAPDGRLALRGPACPSAPCPADPGAPTLVFDDAGYVDTGLAGVADRAAGRISLGGRRRGVVQVGGLALSAADVEDAFRRSGVGASPLVQDDPLFGARVALGGKTNGVASSSEAAIALLADAGFGPAFAPVEAAPVAVAESARRSA